MYWSTMQNSLQTTISEQEEKVYYCTSCHSLCIVVDETLADDGWDGSYCAKCGNTHVGVTTMREWLAEEQRRKDKRRELEWSK